jgi:hypothetical protein
VAVVTTLNERIWAVWRRNRNGVAEFLCGPLRWAEATEHSQRDGWQGTYVAKCPDECLPGTGQRVLI